MPPAAKRKRAPRAPRCSYIEDDRRCGADGIGNPPLCGPHTAILRAAAEAPYNPLGQVVGAIREGRPVSLGDTIAAAVDVFAAMLGGRQYVPQAGPVNQPPPRQPPPGQAGWDPFAQWFRDAQQRRQEQQPPPRADEAVEARAGARKVFGWKPGHTFTGDELKARYRELAKRNHPDRGGSVDKMSKINAAMDVLTVELNSR